MVRTPPLQLTALLALSEGIYLALQRLEAVNGVRPVLIFLALLGAQFALYAAAYLIVRRMRSPTPAALFVVGAGAVLFRLTLLPAGLPHDTAWREVPSALRADLRGDRVTYERFLLFDSDVWRYLWDGHVWAHGANPYLHAPADPELDAWADEENVALTDGLAVWSDIRDNITYAGIPTVYPPLAQGVFRLSHRAAPGSVLAMKELLVGFDLLAALFIALTLVALGRPAALVILYAWNPLLIKVFAGSGHMDAVVVAMLAATSYFVVRGWRALAAVSFGLAILSKLSPLVLLPFVVRRIGLRYSVLAGGLVLAGYTPFLGASSGVWAGLLTFAREWQFNAGPFALIQWIGRLFGVQSALAGRAICGLAILAWVSWLGWRDDGRRESFASAGAGALGALIVLSSAVMPWYVTWVLPLALVADQRLWYYFSGLVCVAFLVMIDGTEYASVLWLEYSLFAGILVKEFWQARRSGASGTVKASSLGPPRSWPGESGSPPRGQAMAS